MSLEIRPLAGAATIVSGAGAAVESDVFSQQAGELIASAIQTARENQANQIEHNLRSNIKVYSIYRAQRDVIEYHNMCSLETALKQTRASLQATSPDGGLTPPAAQGSQTPGGVVAPQVQQLRDPPRAKDFSINKASEALPPPIPRPPATLQPKGRTDYERRLSRKLVSEMQAALCVTPNDGVLGETTRTAAKTYQDASQRRQSADGTIDVNTVTSIQDAISTVGSCIEKGYLNAYEVGRYGVSPGGSAAAIIGLQQKLKAAVQDVAVPLDGSFLPRGAANKTREAIKRVRKDNNLPELDGQVDADLMAKAKELQAR